MKEYNAAIWNNDLHIITCIDLKMKLSEKQKSRMSKPKCYHLIKFNTQNLREFSEIYMFQDMAI